MELPTSVTLPRWTHAGDMGGPAQDLPRDSLQRMRGLRVGSVQLMFEDGTDPMQPSPMRQMVTEDSLRLDPAHANLVRHIQEGGQFGSLVLEELGDLSLSVCGTHMEGPGNNTFYVSLSAGTRPTHAPNPVDHAIEALSPAMQGGTHSPLCQRLEAFCSEIRQALSPIVSTPKGRCPPTTYQAA